MSSTRRAHDRETDRAARRAAPLVQRPAFDTNFESIMRRSAVDHARATLPAGAFCTWGPLPDGMPALEISTADDSFNAHHKCRGDLALAPCGAAGLRLDDDVDTGAITLMMLLVVDI